MTDAKIRIEAYRYVYGKLVQEPGGAVEPGFEHRPTSISANLPPDLTPLCRPEELLKNRSIDTIVHPTRRAQGARIFWPWAADGGRWMLATCVRARPEAGERAASRTYTQLVTYVFSESDWSRHAPRLIANAGRWLRAEPDTPEVYARETHPMAVIDADLLPEVPPCADAALPEPEAPLWRLISAIEHADTELVCGAADGFRGAETFQRALACAAALLPRELRIHLTAALGLAEPTDGFALQFLPETGPRTEAPAGLLSQLGGALTQGDRDATPADLDRAWQEVQAIDDPGAGYKKAHSQMASWKTPQAARRALADLVDQITAARSVDDLRAWLQRERPDCPPRPRLDKPATGAAWIAALTAHIRDGLADRIETGLDRAVVRLATLIDPGSERLGSLGLFWRRAWLDAAKAQPDPTWLPGGITLARPVLCWSALVGSDAADSETESIGRIRDFAELRAVTLALELVGSRSAASKEQLASALGSRAFRARLDDLRRRADHILAIHPETIVDLAESMPALIAPRPGEDHVGATAAAEVIDAIALAARLRIQADRERERDQYLDADDDDPPDPRTLRLLRSAEAVRCALQGSTPPDGSPARSKQDILGTLLGCFWRLEFSPKKERTGDARFWLDAVSRYVADWLQGMDGDERWWQNTAGIDALRYLLRDIETTYRETRDVLGRRRTTTELSVLNRDTEAHLESLAETCLDLATRPLSDPALRATLLLQGLPDIADLAQDPTRPIRNPVSLPWKQRICRDIKDPAGTFDRLSNGFLRQLDLGLKTYLDRVNEVDPNTGLHKEAPQQIHLKPILEVETILLMRLSRCDQPPPRRPILDLIEKTQRLIPPKSISTGARHQDQGHGAPALRGPVAMDAGGEQETPIAMQIDETAVALAHCVIRWAELVPPRPEFDAKEYQLAGAPIFQSLARRLGFPTAAYFGGLTSANQKEPANQAVIKSSRVDTPQPTSLHMPDESALNLVIAPGAAEVWRRLFDEQRKFGEIRNLLTNLASTEALCALAQVLENPPPGYDKLVDDDTRFVIGFFIALGSDRSPFADAHPPEELETALLSNGRLHDTCYAIGLARAIAIFSDWHVKNELVRLFTCRERNSRLAKRVMGIGDSGWTGFSALDQAAKRKALLRLLFLLSIVVEDGVQGQTWRHKVQTQDLRATLQLAPSDPEVKSTMKAFLTRNQDLAVALTEAAALVRCDLAGWPLDPR